MSTTADRLRLAAEQLPPGASLTLTREQLLEALGSIAGSQDLDVAQLAEHFGRSPSTIRTWLERGELRGYRFRGRQWRATRAAVAEFEAHERAGEPRRPQTAHDRITNLGAWRNARA